MGAPRLVASDVDGTLLGADGEPGPRLVGVLERMTGAGVPLVIATGRPPRWIAPVCDAIGVHGLCVAANGAVLWDAGSGRVVEAAELDTDALAEVIDRLRTALPGAGLAVERVDAPEFCCEPAYEHAWPQSDHVEIAAAELAARPAVKVLARRRGLESDAMAAAVRDGLGDLVDVTFSASNGLVECSVPGVTKARGLALAAAHHGVDAADVVAFGDMPNDLEMLRWAGHGVAMGNAHPEVLAAADEIAGHHDDDGVAAVLERWFSRLGDGPLSRPA
ncbi:HAD family hydrolase [Actinomycetospora sp. OC33-EN08]|uniref:HAD family hydrolase n=1 Tax=Actinomycetospora aurantiaca TaxID=3129233 RepID=A0ABU8MSR5_9PSEU